MKFLFLLPGLVCLLMGYVFLQLFRNRLRKEEASARNYTAKARARLVGNGERESIDYKYTYTVYCGIYEFNTADGQLVSAPSEFSYRSPEQIPGADGETVEICYDPDHPTDFSLTQEQTVSGSVLPSMRKGGITLLVIGGILTAVAAAGLLGAFDSLFKSLLG